MLVMQPSPKLTSKFSPKFSHPKAIKNVLQFFLLNRKFNPDVHLIFSYCIKPAIHFPLSYLIHFAEVYLLLLLLVGPAGTPPIALQPSRPFVLLTPL
jgi:hypothetical protein